MSVRLSAALSGAVEAQLAARTRILENGAASVGWKTAASIPGIDADEGVDGSIFGFLTSDTTLTAGSQVDAGVTVELCAEVELAVGVGHDVIPDTDFDTVAAAVPGIAGRPSTRQRIGAWVDGSFWFEAGWSKSRPRLSMRAQCAHRRLRCSLPKATRARSPMPIRDADGHSWGFITDRAACRRCASVPAIVIHRQEVSPMNAVSAVGAPLQCTIARLR